MQLRRHLLRQAEFKGPISVLDCFSGGEVIWNTLRTEFEVGEYLALDVKPKRGRLKMDSLRYLQNQEWTHDVIDLDAYGSPWRHYFEVAKRRRPAVVFLTIGNTLWKQQQSEALEFLGLKNLEVPSAIQAQLAELVLETCLAAPFDFGLKITGAAEANNPGGSARYLGVILRSV